MGKLSEGFVSGSVSLAVAVWDCDAMRIIFKRYVDNVLIRADFTDMILDHLSKCVTVSGKN